MSAGRTRVQGAPGAALAALAIGLAASFASAQQAEQPRGWLGVGLQELMQCRVHPSGENGCWKRLVVTRVVVGGPADRGGIQPGDTILALNGDALETGIADPAFAALRSGTPARLVIGRGGRRSTVRLVPGERPTGTVAVRVPIAPGEMGVVRRPVGQPPAPPEVRPEPEQRIVIRGEGGGLFQIEPQVELRLEGAEGEGVVVQVAPRALPDAPRQTLAEYEGRFGGYTDREGEVPRSRYVRLDPGPELQALMDSVFRTARVRFDSLQRALVRDGARYRGLVDRMQREAPGQLGWTTSFGRGVAGAEFEPLSPELAEFFQGTSEGLLCLRIVDDTPADRLGLRPGDVVIEVGGRSVASLDDLRTAFRSAGDRPVVVRWLRKGRPMEGSVRY